MDIKQVVPHVGEDGLFSMTATEIFYAVVNKIHFERRIARDIGWRGILPCPGQEWTWTCRVFENDNIFGIVHDENLFSREATSFCDAIFAHDFFERDAKNVWGKFSLFVFPPHDSQLLEYFSLHALYLSEQEYFLKKIREWSFSQKEFAQFYVGDLYLGISVNSLCLRLETKDRSCVLSATGVAYEENGHKKYVIEPMGIDANIPAYELISPLFDCIVRTFANVLYCNQKDMFCIMEKKTYLVPAYDDIGNLFQSAKKQTAIARTLQWGERIWPESKDEKEDLFSLAVEREKGTNLPFVHILSGFLGSGKTTFLREWLAYLQNKDIYLGVIQNEFGKIGLDAFLLQGDTVVEAIDEGCVCCSLSDALRPGVCRILDKMPTKDILLETSGVANPLNIIQAIRVLDDVIQIGLVIVLVDASFLSSEFENKNSVDGILRSQIEHADVLVVNKIDLLEKTQEDDVCTTLREMNGNAFVLKSRFGRIPFAVLDHALDKIHIKCNKEKEVSNFSFLDKMSCTHKEEGFESRVLFFKKTNENELKEILIASHAVRAKGIVFLESSGRSIVQFASFNIEFVSISDDQLPSDQDYIVFIGNKLNHGYLDKIEAINNM